MPRILLVDDDPFCIELLFSVLKDRYDLDYASTGDEALKKLQFFEYDLVILDLVLPDMTGTRICLSMRQSNINIPVLMLTSISSSKQTEENLDAGADDYLVKPFEGPVLCARIRALLRRSGNHAVATNILVSGDLSYDTKSRRLRKGDVEVHLLPRESALLEFFLRHPNQIFSSEALLERVWKTDSEAMVDTVRAHIKSLRKKIDSEGKSSRITNLRGHGYRFD